VQSWMDELDFFRYGASYPRLGAQADAECRLYDFGIGLTGVANSKSN